MSSPYPRSGSPDDLTSRVTSRSRRARWDDDEPAARRDGSRRLRPADVRDLTDAVRDGDGSHLRDDDPADLLALPDGATRATTWQTSTHGPRPRPSWLVTDLSAVDADLGVLKTGKEADVHLLRRWVPGGAECLLAAKRYRTAEHRMFHRDAGYLEGRRVRRSREMRAMARRTEFGRDLLAGQWAAAEFAALCRIWEWTTAAGTRLVPYPVALDGTELLVEFVGDVQRRTAAPRLAQCRDLEAEQLHHLWRRLVEGLHALAALGYAHGDLSPYNLLVDGDDLIVIDLPQVVDLVVNPQGPSFLERDVRVVADWFLARGLPHEEADVPRLLASLMREAVG
ncbi:MAG: RIO1 family regulatory kinase/ATPase [Kineosporiaceae bacterium]